MKKKLNIGAIIFYVVLIAILIFSIVAIFKAFNKGDSYTYNEMLDDFNNNRVYGYEYNMNNDKMTVILKDEEGKEYTKVCKFTTIDFHNFFAPYYGEGDLKEIEDKWEGDPRWNLDKARCTTVPVEE